MGRSEFVLKLHRLDHSESSELLHDVSLHSAESLAEGRAQRAFSDALIIQAGAFSLLGPPKACPAPDPAFHLCPFAHLTPGSAVFFFLIVAHGIAAIVFQRRGAACFKCSRQV